MQYNIPCEQPVMYNFKGNSNDEEGDKTKNAQDDELIADENIVPFDTDHVTGI